MALLCVMLPACWAQGSGPRELPAPEERCALILTDDDIPSGSATAGAIFVDEAEQGRELLTADVAAVARGFLEGGLSCVDVVDSHDGAIDARVLQKMGVRVLSPSKTRDWLWPFLGPMQRHYVVAALVGYHSRAGQQGFRPHTINDRVRELRIQGRPAGEVTHMLLGLTAFDVPLVLVSGDMNATAEAAALLPDVKQVTVRWMEPDGSTGFLDSEQAALELREAARVAAESNPEPYRLQLPISISLEASSREMLHDRSANFNEAYQQYFDEAAHLLEDQPRILTLLEMGLFPTEAVSGSALSWQANSALAAYCSVACAASQLRGSVDTWGKVSKAYSAYIAGKYEKALDTYQDVLDLDPYDVATRCRMAAVYEKLGDFESARDLFLYGFQRLDEIGDDAMKTWCLSGLATVDLELGESHEARRAALQLMALKDRRGSHQKALELMERATTRTQMPEGMGLEGFFPVDSLPQSFLDGLGIPLDRSTLVDLVPRVGKLVIYKGEGELSEERLLAEREAFCGLPHQRLFNRDKCMGYEQRRCGPEICNYPEYGNCSGLFLGSGLFITAAHCTAGMAESREMLGASRILRFQWTNSGWRESRYEIVELFPLKRSWDDSWVISSPNLQDHMDAALLRFEEPGGDFEPIEPADLPQPGEPLFMMGYPRSMARPARASGVAGYDQVHGELAVSFGRVVDRNESDAPLCSTTGRQDDWSIVSPCESASGTDEQGQAALLGMITDAPFLSNIDTMNGYSGAPVFDTSGRWVGMNITVFGADPREGYTKNMRVVHIKSNAVMEALMAAGVPGLAGIYTD